MAMNEELVFEYEVKHGRWQHVIALLLLGFLFATDYIFGHIVLDLLPADKSNFVSTFVRVTEIYTILCAIYIELWKYRQKLIVVESGKKYLYQSVFGAIKTIYRK